MWKRILLLSVLYVYVHIAFSNESNMHYLGIEHGLSNNNVTKIYQDHTGVMWLGTYAGLNKYDGYTFKCFKNIPGSLRSLPDNRITDIIEDGDGLLWVATKNGVAYLSKNQLTFERLSLREGLQDMPINATINKLVMTAKNELYAASEQFGLLRIKKDKAGKPIAENIPLYDKGQKIKKYNVRGLAMDKQNRIWVMVHEHGLFLYDASKNHIVLKQKYILSGSDIVITPDSNIWMVADNGIYRYDPAKNTYIHYGPKEGLTQHPVTGLYTHDNNQLWITTDGGGIRILDLTTNKISELDKDITTNLKSQTIYALYKDKGNRTWIGTLRGGVNIIDPLRGRFQHIQVADRGNSNNQQNFVLSFSDDQKGGLWIGTDGGGLLHWERSSNRFKQYGSFNTHLSNNFVTTVLQDPEGTVWLGTYGGGINRLDVATDQFKQYKCISPTSGYVLNNIWKLFMDSRGRIWASTLNKGGLFIYNPRSDTFEPVQAAVYDVLTIFEESPDVFWLGSWSTLIRLDMRTGDIKEINVGNPVRYIHPDNQHSLWVGTEGGGLLHFQKGTLTFKRYTEQDGLPSNSILNILEDKQKNLWLSTYNGLCRFHPKTKKFQNYYESDGLQSNQFSYNAALKLASGELLFGGIRGFNIFDPDSMLANKTIPPLVLTSLSINNRTYDRYTADEVSLSELKTITMNYADATFSFGFAALEYSFPEKIKYAYFLEGWDKDWNYVDNLRTGLYSGLREGKYNLRIKSTNADGVWNPTERVVRIQVLPPWWRTHWAYAAYFALGAGILFLFIRYDRNQTRLRYQVKLVEIKAQQDKELIEKKIDFFTHIAHEFRNPLTLITNPLKEILHTDDMFDKNQLTPIYNNSKRLLTLVNKLLLFRKVESGVDGLRLVRLDLVKLTDEVFQCFKQHASVQKISYRFEHNIATCEILADREKLEICLFNLISNAIKYTPEGGTVLIKLAHRESEVSVEVNDTGCGINEQSGDRIFEMFQRDYGPESRQKDGFGIGLFLVKKFAEAHNGSISYRPVSPKGTCFTLTLTKDERQFEENYVFEDLNEHSRYMDEIVDEIKKENGYLCIDERQKQYSNLEEYALEAITTEKKCMLVVDDNADIRDYLKQLFDKDFDVQLSPNAEEAFVCIDKHEPDIILSDVVMDQISGIDLCQSLKMNPLLAHIPFILLTASASPEVKLKGIEVGADDYVTKPFNRDILVARVNNLIRSRNRLQDYFHKEITLQRQDNKISSEYKEFLEKAMSIVEQHLDDPDFNVKTFADKIGMSHSNFYKRIKSISGKSVNEFIRFVRLRHVAKQLVDTDSTINEAAFSAGFSDIKYFRQQFFKLFGVKPSEYKKKYQTLKQKHQLNIK